MMTYSKLLKKYIEDSGLTLNQIESKLRDKGLATNKAYISKLQNGKLPPAGDEINKALAEVLGGDEEEIILSSYVEKAPILNVIIDNLFNSFKFMLLGNKELFLALARPLANNVEELNENYESTIELIMATISLKEKIEMIKSLPDTFGKGNLGVMTDFQDGVIKIDPSVFLSEVEQEKFRALHQETKNTVLTNLTPGEELYVIKQLELYREMKLESSRES
ncbi:hypothetical protein NSQ55_10735 [Paenibacillus sp. FSL H7-0943]|uniref:hypothetical protein n=1 Tax=Paenibacillus sp. FSL H7-0943 TaxID=2954739 RepID=UPI0030D5567E